jgi:SagB-type dehydrogenase family enzyme
VPPAPALKPIPENAVTIPLAKPDLDALAKGDWTFTQILEGRMSVRDYGTSPLSVMELGEFLYRSARVRRTETYDIDTSAGKVPMDFAYRPYPGGGGLHELEVYCLVQSCEGLDAGLYHYAPLEHALIKVADMTLEVELLAESAAVSASKPVGSVQVVILLASRFRRIAWKYETMAYALTLKNVGVVYQTMYLVATAMGLAPCALGAGNADLFAAAIGSDYFSETSVGEFLLGSLPERP